MIKNKIKDIATRNILHFVVKLKLFSCCLLNFTLKGEGCSFSWFTEWYGHNNRSKSNYSILAKCIYRQLADRFLWNCSGKCSRRYLFVCLFVGVGVGGCIGVGVCVFMFLLSVGVVNVCLIEGTWRELEVLVICLVFFPISYRIRLWKNRTSIVYTCLIKSN